MHDKMKMKEPAAKGSVKVPMIMQMESLECGAACLAMILAYYGKWVPLERVRLDCGVSRDGVSAKNILRAARSYGLNAKGYRCEIEDLKSDGKFPCIIHWNFNHFVVLDGFRRDKAVLNDPARGVYEVPMTVFDEAFTGICLTFETGEGFQPSGKQPSILTYAGKRLRSSGTAVLFVILTTVSSSLIGIIYPAFSRIFLDYLLPGKNPDWIMPFIAAMTLISLLQLIVLWIQEVYSLKINGKLAIVSNTTFMWKILRMPMAFFSQRMAGDIQVRKDANMAVASSLVNTFAPLLLDTLMMVFYLVIMIRYSPILTAIGIASVLMNLIFSNIISKKRMNIARMQIQNEGKLSGMSVSGIEMIETIKSSGAENGFFEKWAGYQAAVNTGKVKFQKLNQVFGILPQIVNAFCSTAILILGVFLTMQGRFTAGMIMAFQGFLNAFTAPASSLISASQTLQEMRSDMERVEDIMNYPEEQIFAEDIKAGEVYRKLSGDIELKDVTFGYSRLAEPLIRDFNLSLKAGSRVALVGASGCGKSTIARMIAGLYKPWKGEILFDGQRMSEIERNIFTSSVAVVDQDIILFEDTIANNIKMWDNSVEDTEMIKAAKDAQIHEDIMQREGGYQYRLAEGGADFSGGQRQRIEIARGLAQNPTIMILDEATSALDAKTEYQVVNAIKNRKITCIVVAHRLSTIRDCDEIIVLDRGKVIERGTHHDLMNAGGLYAQLVSNE